jgi:GxxExxY protein
MGLLFEDLTRRILESSFEVSNELGVGFLESVYENALCVALAQKHLEVERQKTLNVMFRGVTVGVFKADIVVEDKVIVELKVVENLRNEHFAQLLNYMKAGELRVGMIVNFGNPKLQYRRFDNRFLDEPKESTGFEELLRP